ncbi:hypothetical protein GLU01_01690 [Nanohaloarchaea archaeon]|nr:hypothetical protein [Candidatus Nanohaloarchaea archaeon]
MTINAGNDEIYEITIDGTQVREVTVDGVIAWVEANFDVRNLTAPNEVTEGDNFTITADVKNTGDGRDTQTISFNRGGSTDKTLKGGQTTTVSFGETINNSGDFTLKISSDDDSASQTVTVLTPANFDIRNLSAPNTVTEGNNFNVSADVVNTGQTSDTQTISFNRGGSTNKSLSGNSSTNVSFNETINSTGTFNLSISSADDTESRNITVESAIPDSVVRVTFDNSNVVDSKGNVSFDVFGTESYTFNTTKNSTVMDTTAIFSAISKDNLFTGISSSNTWSYMCWYFRTDLSKNDRLVGFSTNDSGNCGGFIFYDNSSSSAANNPYYRQNQSNIFELNPSSNFDTWNHVAVTCDGSGNLTGYINGNQAGSGSISASSSPEGFGISSCGEEQTPENSGGDNFEGLIDDVRFYDVRLSGQEISDIYNNTKP